MARRQSGFRERTTVVAAIGHEPALVVGKDARWLRLSSGTHIELLRQRALRLILLAMARERIVHPGRALSAERLLVLGWPGERVMPAAGSIRVRVAISKLRSLGLRDIISSRDDGYLLRADADVVFEEEACMRGGGAKTDLASG